MLRTFNVSADPFTQEGVTNYFGFTAYVTSIHTVSQFYSRDNSFEVQHRLSRLIFTVLFLYPSKPTPDCIPNRPRPLLSTSLPICYSPNILRFSSLYSSVTDDVFKPQINKKCSRFICKELYAHTWRNVGPLMLGDRFIWCYEWTI
jgi:hypothetical protein